MQQKKIINSQLIDVFITSKTLLIKPTPLLERKNMNDTHKNTNI